MELLVKMSCDTLANLPHVTLGDTVPVILKLAFLIQRFPKISSRYFGFETKIVKKTHACLDKQNRKKQFRFVIKKKIMEIEELMSL